MFRFEIWNFFIFKLIFIATFISLSETVPVKKKENSLLNDRPGDIIARYLNESVDPCDDFYAYSCGHWKSYNAPLEGYPIWSNWYIIAHSIRPKVEHILNRTDLSTENEAIHKARRVYRACMDDHKIEALGVAPIVAILEENGDWPLLMDSEETSTRNTTWQKIHSNLIKTLGTEELFALDISVDPKNSSIHRLILTQPSLLLKRKELISSDNVRLMRFYKKYIRSVVRVIETSRAYCFFCSIDTMTKIREIEKMVEFEIKLAEIMEENRVVNDVDKWYNLMTIDEFQRFYDSANTSSDTSKINWLETIRDIFTLTPEVTIDGNEEIIVASKGFFMNLAKLLDETPAETIVNFVLWRMVMETSYYTTSELRNHLILFNNKRTGADPIAPRRHECVTESQMERAVSYAFVNEYFSSTSKDAALSMVENIQEAMKKSIRESKWMDDETKILAIEKVDAIEKFVGYPDDYNSTTVDDYYKEFEPTDNYFENEARRRNFLIKIVLKNLRKPVERKMWRIDPISVNAYYIPLTNSIVLPTGILQSPLFDLSRPSVINYGMIGSTIGHEISHALDSTGRRYDQNGNAVVWWSQHTIEKYEEQTQCFIDQFDHYTIYNNEERVIYVNGTTTLEENISDSTGLQVTWDAYKIFREKNGNENGKILGLEKFSDDQIFFLSFANLWCTYESNMYLQDYSPDDEHSPAKARVNGAVSNVDAFAAAFNCPSNSPGNPQSRCNMWQ